MVQLASAITGHGEELQFSGLGAERYVLAFESLEEKKNKAEMISKLLATHQTFKIPGFM